MTESTLDPDIRAEIEAEFAELTAEISRINALPQTPAPEKVAMLEALRAQWRERKGTVEGEDERPEWRQSIDRAVSAAVDGLLEDGLRVDLDGQIQFDLQGDTLKAHGQPVVDALLTGLRATLAERFPGLSAASQAGVDPGRVLMATLLGGLQQAVRSATEGAEEPKAHPPEPTADAKPTAPSVSMNIDFGGLIGALLQPKAPAAGSADDPPKDPEA